MIGEFFAEFLGEFVKEFVFMPISYMTGKALVRLFSFGMLHTTFDQPHEGKRKKPKQPPQQGLFFVRNGKRYLDYRITMLIGLLAWVVVIAGVVVALRAPG